MTTDFRINRPTVEILLSRVYLYTGKWKEAVESATEANPDWWKVGRFDSDREEWMLLLVSGILRRR